MTGAAGGVGEAGGASGHMGGRARSARWFSCTIVRFDFPLPGVVVGVVNSQLTNSATMGLLPTIVERIWSAAGPMRIVCASACTLGAIDV